MSQRIVFRIGERKFERINAFNISLRYNSFASVFSVGLQYDDDNESTVSLFNPFSRRECTIDLIEENGSTVRLMTGLMVNFSFSDSNSESLIIITGYSLPGVMAKSNTPLELYPLQRNNVTISELVKEYCDYFEVGFLIAPDATLKANEVFKKTLCQPSELVSDFLSRMANQRGLVITHTNTGKLLVQTVRENDPSIAKIEHALNMNLSVKTEEMHPFIYLQKQADKKGGASRTEELRNPLMSSLLKKPKVIGQTAEGTNDRQVLANEYRKIKLKISLDKYLTIPNKIIEVKNKRIRLNRFERFFIESVTIKGDEKSLKSNLECVIPEVYSVDLKSPKNIFV